MRSGKWMGAIVFCVMAIVARSSAAQSTSSWECLPEETLVALRIPNGQAYVETLAKNTKFGVVLFSEQRRAAVTQVLESSDSSDWQQFQEQLQAYELTTTELLQLFAGETGYAVVRDADRDVDVGEQSRLFGFGWLEPGEELTQKIYDALGKMIEDQDDEQVTTRIDIELADRHVMQLQVPSIEVEHEAEFDTGDDYDDLSEEEQEEAWERAYAEWEASVVEVVTHRSVLVSKWGDRLLVAHHFQSYDEEELGAATEQLTALFGRWLAAHAEDQGDFIRRITEDPGAARVMALEGESWFEMLGDLTPLIEMLKASEPLQPHGEQIVRLVGLEGVGVFATRVAWQDEGITQTQMSIALPAPRQGLMRLFDQEALAIDPPAWVPASAVSYYQLSFDLGKAYEVIKEELLREFPEQVEGKLALAEAQVQAFAGASLSEVLSSLGNRHTILSFGAESTAGEGESAAQRATEKAAFVWQIEDAALWQRLLTALTPLVSMAPGVESAEEQGFSGWRMNARGIEGGLFVGKGYLVLGTLLSSF